MINSRGFEMEPTVPAMARKFQTKKKAVRSRLSGFQAN
jgi:hypothetical protein